MFTTRFKELEKTLQSAIYTLTNKQQVTADEALKQAIALIGKTRLQNGIVYVIGNGGSAGIASHFSTDLIKCVKVPSHTFYDTNVMTCLSNDYGYENVFSYPLNSLMKPNDLLIAISSSGKSPNIVKAAETALQKKGSLFTLTGFSTDNPLRELGHLNYWIDRSDYGLVETAHFFLLHTIIDLWNITLPTGNEYAKIFRDASRKNKISAGTQ